MQEFTADGTEAEKRADVFVASKYPTFTRSSLEMLFDTGQVQINHLIAKASQIVKPGDRVAVDELYLNTKPPVIDLPLIYEDEDTVVINKPEGILTHSKGALNLEGTVASFIATKLSSELSGNRAGIVHRLDRATSGVLVAAKNAPALSKLQKQFSNRKVKKTYQAIVEGEVSPPRALIDAPIMRNPAKPQTFKVGANGKQALTEYRVTKTLTKDGHSYSVVELRPQTGRTHQLRVHMAYINHPIVGDTIYGHGGKGLMLHAQKLELTLPSGERRIFEAPMPKRLEEFLNGE